MFSILQAPNEILSRPAKKVKKIDKSIISLIKGMEETLNKTRDPQGVGLAAPQIGRDLRIFIAKPTDKSPIHAFINPVIEKSIKINSSQKTKKEKSRKLEGCLSLQSIWGEVARERQIIVSYLDEKGISHKKKFSGFLAMIIQHEADHLNGLLFPKRALEQKGKLYKSHKNEKGEDEFEEIEI